LFLLFLLNLFIFFFVGLVGSFSFLLFAVTVEQIHGSDIATAQLICLETVLNDKGNGRPDTLQHTHIGVHASFRYHVCLRMWV